MGGFVASFARSQGARARTAEDPAGERGAATVEFAFALMFLLFLFVAYVQITEIFLAHGRLRYATSVAARAHSVGGSAARAASAVDEDYTLSISSSGRSDVVKLEKRLDLPRDVGKLFGETNGFAISHSVKIYREPSHFGDNKGR